MAKVQSMVQRLARLCVIWWVLVSEYSAYRRFRRDGSDDTIPARFADRLVALGPTFIKFGQILSTRSELLPAAYIEALSKLQEQAPELPFETVYAILEQEFGTSVDALFADFSRAPVAAASLAQVHKAVLHNGSVVAVKVQRPDLERLLRRDLDALQLGLNWLACLFPKRMKRTNLVAFFDEFQRYTLKELDFANEGKTIERFRANFRGRKDVHFPAVFDSHTTSRVLTLQWVEGMRVHEAFATLPAAQRQTLVARIVDVLLQMFVADGLFHADLHPGNIFFHADGSFTLIDFGMIGELSDTQRDRFILYWFAVVQKQTRRAFYHFKRQTRVLSGANETAFFNRFAALAETFYESRLSEMSFTKVYLEMMQAGYEHGFVFPSELMLHAKALTTAEALVFVLAPEARFEKISRPFIARQYLARTASTELVKRRLSQIVPELLLIGEMPPEQALDHSWDWDATVEIISELGKQLSTTVTQSLSDGGLWKSLLETDARKILGEALPGEAADQALAESWKRYYELEASLPIERTLGAVFTTHLALLTLAMHEALLGHDVSKDQSYQLIYDIGWKFYTRMGEPPLLLAAALTDDPDKRLRLATDLFRTFPFGSPSYGWRDVPSASGVVAFDCTRCPVAEFFSRYGASELCVNTWCKLDFPLAEKWGAHLERTGTIAMGAGHCDFRWHVTQSDGDDKHEEPAL
ncbi:MAG: L-2-amino-thiazoline-4-carboxylic acid hydrolase [Myxococcales bacterium]|nr:MAG: L-2-amino-thiazoline-4-carboxylic acid hydrolase [Myxococcales bacterium]